MILELLPSFVAGLLTIAAPCILPVLPVVLGGSIGTISETNHLVRRPLAIVLGLTVSIVLFTLLLKASTSLLGVPQIVWQIISASILLVFGFTFLLPAFWGRVSEKLALQKNADLLLIQSTERRGLLGNFLIGAALGPVFNSCSPTYALIVAIILPRSFSEGLTHLVVYSVGLAVPLLAIALLGRSAVQRIQPLANPNGALRKGIGALLILVALLILTGYDKKFQAFVLEKGWYDPVSALEMR